MTKFRLPWSSHRFGFDFWEDIGRWVLGTLAILVVTGLVVLLGVAIYFGFTGGFTYLDHQKVNGIECIVTHDRFTGEPDNVSCPPVQR